MSKVYTWIDQTICTGDGICREICPDIYFEGPDGLYFVKEEKEKPNKNDPRLQGASGLALVPEHLLDDVIEAAEECPGTCIFFEVVED